MRLSRAVRAMAWGGTTALLVCGCGAADRNDLSAGRHASAPAVGTSTVASATTPVQLPDLAPMTPAVQQQIREKEAAIAQAATSGDASASAAAHGAMGTLLLAVQSLDAAARYLERAQALAPEDRRWPYYLGYLARSRGALDRAAAHFERALALKDDDLATQLRLADVYLSQGSNDKAAVLFERVLAGDGRSAAALFGLGRVALGRGAHADAVRHLERALAIAPQAAAIHYPLSLAYRELGNTSKADEHLKRRQEGSVPFPDPLLQAVTEPPDSPAVYERHGIRALDAGDWAGAAEQFRKGLALAPHDPSLGQRLGTALFMMGDATGARRELRRVVAESPGFARAHYSLGLLLESDGRMGEAVERFQEAVRLEPAYVEARVRLASALGRSGRLADALSQYRETLQVDPRIAGARYAQAIALARLRRDAEARDVLAEGMRLHPDQPSFALGLARLLAASPDAAIRNGTEARHLLDGLADADRASDGGETIAMVLAELGVFDGAKAWQRRALDVATQSGRRAAVAGMTETLARYERGEPSRTPWRADELP